MLVSEAIGLLKRVEYWRSTIVVNLASDVAKAEKDGTFECRMFDLAEVVGCDDNITQLIISEMPLGEKDFVMHCTTCCKDRKAVGTTGNPPALFCCGKSMRIK